MLEVKKFSLISKDEVILLKDISLNTSPGMAVGLTGQSGAGKTTLLKSILGLLDRQYKIIEGEIMIDNESLYAQSPRRCRDYCGTTLGFIPQNPMTAFDCRVRIGKQLAETLRLRSDLSGKEAKDLLIGILSDLGLSNPKRVMDSYPAQLSGGMLQRVTIALLLALNPKYILADEPTSALDNENRALLLAQLEQRKKHSGILFISHDVDALTRLCERVHVMEQGQITEVGSMAQLMTQPKRAWTRKFATAAQSCGQEEWVWMD